MHVGIIMDGNGRWAAERGLTRLAGHSQGARKVTEIVNACPGLDVSHLTLFAFSTENWLRPRTEVDGLMRIFRQYIRRKTRDLVDHNVRVRFIGVRDRLSTGLVDLMASLEDATRACTGLRLTIAINYGARDEMVRAVRTASLQASLSNASDISAQSLSAALDTADMPDPDLIIRTSGEMRLSNFLLLQSVRSELRFVDFAWPEITPARLRAILEDADETVVPAAETALLLRRLAIS